MIRGAHGRNSIAAIARRVAVIVSALERRFRAAVGTSPKGFSRLARLQYALCALWDTREGPRRWPFEAGYTDQPHMVRDFKLFTGTSPEQFLFERLPPNLATFYEWQLFRRCYIGRVRDSVRGTLIPPRCNVAPRTVVFMMVLLTFKKQPTSRRNP